jgi:hypothetical protein
MVWPIISGVFLWCFVVVAHMAGVQLGATATIILLSLGAVLVASYAIKTVKVSASGFELTTKEEVVSPVQLHVSMPSSLPRLPQIDWVKCLCYIIFAVFFIAAFISLMIGLLGGRPDPVVSAVSLVSFSLSVLAAPLLLGRWIMRKVKSRKQA